MASYTTGASGGQDGYISGGLWEETTVTMGGSASNSIGMRFQIFTGSFDDYSRALDPNRLYSPFTLTLYTSNVVAGDTAARLLFVPESAPAVYSDSDLPQTRGDTVLGGGAFLDSDGVTVTASTKTISTGTAANTAVSWTDVDLYSLLPYTNISDWNGYVCLTIILATLGSCFFHTSRASSSAYYPTLTTNEVAFHTGVLDGPAVGRRARSRICPKLGVPVASDMMVRDGYNEGLMVSPEAWDPEAPEDRYVPSPLEGVLDDEY